MQQVNLLRKNREDAPLQVLVRLSPHGHLTLTITRISTHIIYLYLCLTEKSIEYLSLSSANFYCTRDFDRYFYFRMS